MDVLGHRPFFGVCRRVLPDLRGRSYWHLVAFLFVLSVEANRNGLSAAPADLDFSYQANLPLGGAGSIFVQSDGRAIAGPGNLIRLLADGSRDAGFRAATQAWSVVGIQTDGKYVAAGPIVFGQKQPLLRLEPGGAVDPSFQAASFEIDTGWTPVTLNSVAVQNDGKWVVAGYFHQVNGVRQPHLARLNADGTMDESYRPEVGTNGVAQLA